MLEKKKYSLYWPTHIAPKFMQKKFHGITEHQDGRNLKYYLLTLSCVVQSILKEREAMHDRLEKWVCAKQGQGLIPGSWQSQAQLTG